LVPALVLAMSIPASTAAQNASTLTGAPGLVQVYDAILDARFNDVPDLRKRACPPAPAEACQVLDAVSLWWRIQLDPLDLSHDREFQSKADAAIAATEAWAAREPRRAEAWFYVGGAYGARAQWRVLRGERLGAARDGKRIKESLEQALALDPRLQEAYFGIGLYHYYAAVAPAAAKVLRWLLLLPGGDKAQGMKEMLQARENGQLLRDEADYQLQIIYLWYEKQPQRALDLLAELRRRHEQNPLFLQLIAETQDTYLHDLTGSLRSWQSLLESARAHRVEFTDLAATRARLGAALQLDRLFETDAAIEQLQAVVDAKPTAPVGAYAQAQLQLGQALDRMGDRSRAIAAYNAAIAAAPAGDPLGVVVTAKSGLRRTPDAVMARAYRLSIEGWRALEKNDLPAAAQALDQSLALKPDDPVTRYRYAVLLQAQKNDPAALLELEALVKARATTPPTIYAATCVAAARIYERQRSPARAIELYRIARGVFGADQQTKEAADRALARLSL